MSIVVEIPDPLASQVAAAAKSHATSLEQYVLEAVAKTVADEPTDEARLLGDSTKDAVRGLFADEPELMDSVVEQALLRRRTALARTLRE